jgi:hypothetical protein
MSGHQFFESTDELITADALRQQTGYSGVLPEEIQVCAGVYIREISGLYRFWRDADWED